MNYIIFPVANLYTDRIDEKVLVRVTDYPFRHEHFVHPIVRISLVIMTQMEIVAGAVSNKNPIKLSCECASTRDELLRGCRGGYCGSCGEYRCVTTISLAREVNLQHLLTQILDNLWRPDRSESCSEE